MWISGATFVKIHADGMFVSVFTGARGCTTHEKQFWDLVQCGSVTSTSQTHMASKIVLLSSAPISMAMEFYA